MEIIQIATYILALLFILGFVSKFIKYSKMPIHLRWELYPIAGETKRPWGGSYLEESDWRDKPQEEKSFLAEIKFMGQEILCFREYFERNRGLWYIVYPFHVGIFLLVGFFGLLLIGAFTLIGDMAVSGESANIWGKLVYYLTLVTGVVALITGTVSCFALLLRKLVDNNMKPYTRRIEYFNILFVLAIFITGILSWAIADSTFATAREFTKGLITLDSVDNPDAIISAHIILIGLFLAYLPYSNMMHFFMKHFTYNFVRWDDKAHLRGSAIERKLEPLLEQQISWAAPHVQGISKWSSIPNLKQTEQMERKEGSKHAKRVDKA